MNRKINKPLTRLRWDRIFLVSFALGLVVAALIVLLKDRNSSIPVDESITLPRLRHDDYFESRQKWLLSHKRIREQFVKGKTFYELLAGCGVSPQDIMQVNESIKPFFDLSQAKPGQKIDIWLNKKSKTLEKISLYLLPEGTIHTIRNGSEFSTSLVSSPKITIPEVISGEVCSCFYQSAIDKGLSSDVIMEIADIFAWDIDFLVDIRPGDIFQVVLQKCYRKGVYIGHGKILAARFVNQGRAHTSFYFNGSQERSGYYDRRGRSLRKAFLKSPLRYRRISSYFSKRRLHPILKIYRPHYGVDYAAPIGTPVESVGDGRISFIGWKRGYGRYIRIRHNHIYETAYGHLKRVARGLKKGTKIRQGKVIGYVGSSGLSTGPHLDFSVIKRGRFIDPLRIKSPPVLTLKGGDKRSLDKVIIQMEKLWQNYQSS